MQTELNWVSFVLRIATRVALVGCTACSGGSGSEKPVKLRLPWLDTQAGTYKSQDVEVTTLTDVHHLEGSVARVRYKPILKKDGKELNSERQRFRFIQDSGVHVPGDTETLQVSAVYAHYEKLRKQDEEFGIADVLDWPRTVGVQVRLTSESDPDKVEINNAFYDGRADMMIVVPYEAEHLPMTLNGGIIAHEHFHALFQRLVLNEIAQGKFVSGHASMMASEEWQKAKHGTSAQEYNRWLLRAINEGLADVWAWIYNQDDEFVARSLPSQGSARSLTTRATPVPAQATLEKKLESLKGYQRLAYAYALGTRYARVLRALAAKNGKRMTDKERKEFAKAIVSGMKDFAKEARKSWMQNEKMDPAVYISSFKKANPKWAEEHCRELSEFTLISQNNQREACK